MIRMWKEKHRAHSSTRRSPLEMLRLSLMHSSAMPQVASTTPIHTCTGGFLRRKRPSSGTMTMYSAVIKPALPGVVVWMPICCSMEARQRARPHRIPPVASVLTGRGAGAPPEPSRRMRDRLRHTSGSSTSEPSRKRVALKVNGPTCSIPTDWATKDTPQIKAVSSSMAFPRSFLDSFNAHSPSLSINATLLFYHIGCGGTRSLFCGKAVL